MAWHSDGHVPNHRSQQTDGLGKRRIYERDATLFSSLTFTPTSRLSHAAMSRDKSRNWTEGSVGEEPLQRDETIPKGLDSRVKAAWRPG